MKNCDRFCVLIPAAGTGERMQSHLRKPFMPLDSVPILLHTLARIRAAKGCGEIILALHPDDLKDATARYGQMMSENFGVSRIIAGGRSRRHTVSKTLECVPDDAELVLIHDGVRPLVRPDMIEMVVGAAKPVSGGAIAAVPVKATIKEVDPGGLVVATPSRDRFWAAQTPQVFHAGAVTDAYEQAAAAGWDATDDAELVKKAGYDVAVRMGSYDNIKVTGPEDLSIAEALLRRQKEDGTGAWYTRIDNILSICKTGIPAC